MDIFQPSYDNYRKIIRAFKESGKYMDFPDALDKEEFLLLHHDVEFSLDKAYALAKVEAEEEFVSSYMVQITNNAYNAFSKKNMTLIHEIADMGHHIGLHYHLNGQTEYEDVRDGIRDQLRVFSELLGIKVDRFSVHRPIPEVYYHKIVVPGVINTYGPDFFTYCEDVTDTTELEIRYITDSKHRWNYGYPDAETLNKYKKVHFLIHPDSWGEQACDLYGMFDTILREKNEEMIKTMNGEFQRFSEIKDRILKNWRR